MDALVETEIREEGGDAVAKNESLSKSALLKGLPPKNAGSSRLLPKGTKAKVNLEEQGRQKVSFSFSQIKKPLQNLFLAPPSPERTVGDLQFPPYPDTSPPQDRTGLLTSSRNEQIEPLPPSPVIEPLAPPPAVPSPPKAKLDLGKMHFKKQILSVSASLEQMAEKEPLACDSLRDPPSSEQEAVLKPIVRPEAENPPPQTHYSIVTESTSEETVTGGMPEGKPDTCVKGPVDTSHIGKEDKDRTAAMEYVENSEHRKSQSQSDSTLPGSESDGDSVRTSSSHKSGDLKSTARVDGWGKDVKSNCCVSRGEDLEKTLSHAKAEKEEKDERLAGHSKSERESRRTSSRSSRSDKERRKTKSRSRSRSRSKGSRTSSSYSRSERSSRSERPLRSDRSYYRESERRSYRSSPHRERRSSRSRNERKSRDSSDSEDDHRRTRTRVSDSIRSSTHSSSYRDSKSSSSYSKSEKDSKSMESSRSSESEKRTQSHSRSERYSRRTTEPEHIRKSSPEAEPDHRKFSTLSKQETCYKSSSKTSTSSQSSEKIVQKSTSSSDSEEEWKGKCHLQAPDRLSPSSVSEEPLTTSSEKMDDSSSQQMSPSKPLFKLIGVDRQSQDKLTSPEKIQILSNSDGLSPHGINAEKVECQLADSSQSEEMDCNQGDRGDFMSCTKGTQHLTVSESCSTDSLMSQGPEQTDSPNTIACSGAKPASTYSLRSRSKSQKLESMPAQKVILPDTSLTPLFQASECQDRNLPDKCTNLPDSCVSSEAFRDQQNKGEDYVSSKTLSEDGGEQVIATHCEPNIRSTSFPLNHQICPKDHNLCGSLNDIECVALSEGSDGAGVHQLAHSGAESQALSCQMDDGLEVANSFSANIPTVKDIPTVSNVLCESTAMKNIDIVSESLVTEMSQNVLDAQQETRIAKDMANTTSNCSSVDGLSSIDKMVILEQNPPPVEQNLNESQPATMVYVEKLPDGDHLQKNTKPVELLHAIQCESSLKVTECMAEGLPEKCNKTEQPSSGLLKTKTIHVKKSRWDIVGQDNSDHENSPKMPCNETKPPVKKVISVRSIDFSKECSLEDTCLKKESDFRLEQSPVTARLNLNMEAQTFSKRLVVVVKKEDMGMQGDGCLRLQDKIKLQERMDPSKISPQPQFCDTSLEAEDVKPCLNLNFKHLPKSNHKSSAVRDDNKTQERTGEGNSDQRQGSPWRNKHGSSSSVSLERDVEGNSEESDTEESESDSDDSSIPKKRLLSVVVVPKNSTLTLETRAGLNSSSIHSDSPGQPPVEWQERSWMEPTSQVTDRGEGPCRMLPGRGYHAPQSECSQHSLEACTNVNSPFAAPQSATYQSQSNMVDSTSQLEAARGLGAQQHMEQNPGTHVKPKTLVMLGHAGTFHSQDSWREPDTAYPRHYDGPDSWHGRKRMYRYQQADFSGSDDFDSLGWDFTQPEQPSSTYQQPDSSYGVQPQKPSQSANPAMAQVCGQGNSFWSPPTVSESCRPVYLPVPSHYREPGGQVQPDSLTNDYDDESRGKTAPHSRAATMSCDLPPPAPSSSSFVQAHEISSNCRGLMTVTSESAAIPDTARGEDGQRPHRGRGPPKKRRPELESDSENEAEAGLSSKRERLSEDDGSRTSKDSGETSNQTVVVERPLLSLQNFQDPIAWKDLAKAKKMPPYFDLIEENLYLTERKKNKSHRDIKRMQCECSVLSREERSRGATACGEDCLNRLLMIECSSRCVNGGYCSNRRFQMKQHADFEVILTESKGWGLRAAKDLTPNTFVLEYCGEVLDHKEFKARVKDYARSKNIHYYFMALKNNEIIDATLKGNCSRFMNHSCEPNLNGQLRVGFFTSKTVTAGTELTFDYQFQRYGKEAQKCLCGAPSCRGFLGGENRVSIRAAGGKMKKERTRKKDTVSALTTVDEELEALLENGDGLSDEKQVVSLCRLMVRVETMEQKLTCLKLIQNTQNPACLKQFLDHHGLSLLWIFMVELSEAKGNNIKLQLEIMKSLAVLPISTKNMLEESRVLHFIQRWAQNQALPPPIEQDGYSSENTSRAQTPLNTPDGPPVKPGQELDGDTPKRAVYRRLKIISENSLDSALSDASKVSDGKEDEEEEDEEEEEEDDTSQAEPAEGSLPGQEEPAAAPAEAVEKQELAEPTEGAPEAESESREVEGERTEGQEAEVHLSQGGGEVGQETEETEGVEMEKENKVEAGGCWM
ncbi:hypothetical protein AAFF_G00403720 [Aldrovandia affinis]|uniref:[histone H3]-lysine(36) N-trimethyltransferase n=1 Tax=Aldrovandia affinis TaxID=143900 RepID=A0AAD7X0J1_9TELE|nr:hypothetical protein AAFF_G00403720 [Aldrovandia affinis]